MDMKISSNDPLNPVKTIPVRMAVIPIPVELTSFNAFVNSNDVELTWSTATEVNNSGFSIEKRNINNSGWSEAAFIKGASNSTEIINYNYVDKNVSVGIYSYRLKQIDFDGTVSYSNEVEVDVSAPRDYALMQNFPNPFNPVTTIKFALPERTQVKLSVYNNLGEKVAELVNSVLDAGYHDVQFGYNNLSSGVYFYRLETEKYSQTKKMNLIK
jgi:hypothetical protein